MTFFTNGANALANEILCNTGPVGYDMKYNFETLLASSGLVDSSELFTCFFYSVN